VKGPKKNRREDIFRSGLAAQLDYLDPLAKPSDMRSIPIWATLDRMTVFALNRTAIRDHWHKFEERVGKHVGFCLISWFMPSPGAPV